jgi:hypothetical protein
MLGVVMLNTVMLHVIMLHIIMISVVVLHIIMLCHYAECCGSIHESRFIGFIKHRICLEGPNVPIK